MSGVRNFTLSRQHFKLNYIKREKIVNPVKMSIKRKSYVKLCTKLSSLNVQKKKLIGMYYKNPSKFQMTLNNSQKRLKIASYFKHKSL